MKLYKREFLSILLYGSEWSHDTHAETMEEHKEEEEDQRVRPVVDGYEFRNEEVYVNYKRLWDFGDRYARFYTPESHGGEQIRMYQQAASALLIYDMTHNISLATTASSIKRFGHHHHRVTKHSRIHKNDAKNFYNMRTSAEVAWNYFQKLALAR
jgi:hypothetical protein